MNSTTSGKSLSYSLEDGTGPGLEPVGGEFQPQLETGYPGVGTHLIFVLEDNCFYRDSLDPQSLS